MSLAKPDSNVSFKSGLIVWLTSFAPMESSLFAAGIAKLAMRRE